MLPLRHRINLLVLVLVGVIVATSLPPEGASAGTIRHDRDPQAYLTLGADAKYASVGRLEVTRSTPGFIGSGTLVAPDWILTAAHLLEHATEVRFDVGGNEYRADTWFMHKRWSGDVRAGSDLALVRLDAPVTNVTPATLYRGSREHGKTTTLVGFGRTGTGETGDTSYDGFKRAGRNVIDGQPGRAFHSFEGRLTNRAKIWMVDFDNPAQPGVNVMGSPDPDDLEFLISHGDSGGGAFIDTEAGPLLAGIHSYGEAPNSADDSGYGDITGHTRISKFASWIKSTMKRNRPLEERRLPTAWPLFYKDPAVRELFAGDDLAGGEFASVVDPSLLGTTASASFGSTAVPEPTAAAILVGVGLLALRRNPRA